MLSLQFREMFTLREPRRHVIEGLLLYRLSSAIHTRACGGFPPHACTVFAEKQSTICTVSAIAILRTAKMSMYGAPPAYAAPPQYGAAPPGYAPPGAPARFNPWAAPGWAPRDPTTWAIFQAVDRDRSGSIQFPELVAALTNGGYTKFGVRTARYLMRMFDADRSGTLGYPEFEALMAQVCMDSC